MTAHRTTSTCLSVFACLLLALTWGCSEDAGQAQDPPPVEDAPDAGDTPDGVDMPDGDEMPDGEEMPDEDRLLEEYIFAGDEAYPESVAFDPVERAFYTGSMALGNVTRTDAEGNETVFFDGNETGDWLALGLEVDPERRRLWVCAALGRSFTESELWLLDLDTGERTWSVSLESLEEGAACIDVIVAPDGDVYVADRSFGNVYKASAQTETIELFASDPELEPGVIGQNGIALSEDNQFLYTAKFLPAKLSRISLADPTDVRVIDIKSHLSALLDGGADALVTHEGFIYVASHSQLLRVAPNDDFTEAIIDVHELTRADGGELTGISGVAMAEGALYVARSEVVEFAFGRDPDLPFLLRRIETSVFSGE